jgi:multidrug efflux system membrane fusion protein
MKEFASPMRPEQSPPEAGNMTAKESRSEPLPDTAAAPESGRRWWRWLVGLAVAALLAYAVFPRGSRRSAAAGQSAKGARSVPVVGALVKTGDLGVYVSGLGTVTPINTVTVRSRVDGQLTRVAFKEGQFVHQGDLLVEIDPRPFQVQLLQAEGQKAKDEAALENAKLDLARYEVLIQQDSIPRQQLDTQRATVRQVEAALKTDEGQIESAKLNLVYCRITSPISGRVGLRLVDPGNIIHATDPNGIVVITQLQPITVLFTIPADRLPAVQKQLRAGQKLAVEVFDRDLKNKLASGTLLAVDNQIDQTTGTVRLKAINSNEDTALFPNQFVNARLLVDTLHNTVIVPTAAIQRSPQSTFVYVVKPDSTVDLHNVEVALTEGDQSSVRQGVSPGDVVVIDGVDKLQPGIKVALSMAGGGPPRKPSS